MTLVRHALLALSVAALAGAALRMASMAAPRGLERVLAAAPLAAAAAVLEALALGLVGLGGSTAALALAAVVTWAACRALAPAPEVSAAAELGVWWRERAVGERVLLGALAGAGAAWTAWLFRYPAFGYDSLLYHLPEAIRWVQSGHPGSIEPIVAGLPVGSYPLVYEVLASWGMGIAHSFVPATLLAPAFWGLAAVAGWSCLRGVGAAPAAAGLGTAAVLAAPPALAYGRSGAALDPAALAWLATCAALCVAARRRPALLGPALVAGGLAAGTKTTALPLTLVALAVGFYPHRAGLRRLARPLAPAASAAAVVGGFWYLRDLVQHGSPFWPFQPAPWGDPSPASIQAARFSFLDRPGDTLSRLDSFYLDQSAGMILLLAGALAAPLLAPRRAVAAAALATGLSVLLWLNAPMTGVSDQPGFDAGTADSVRYLLPALGAAALTLALASRHSRPARVASLLVLATSAVLGLVQGFDLGFPATPSATTPLAGLVVGAAVAAAAGRWPKKRRSASGIRPAGLTAPVVGVAAAVVGCLLAPLAGGYVSRHAETGLFDSGLSAYFADREGDERPVTISGSLHAMLAGSSLRREVTLAGPTQPCPSIEHRRRDGWVVFSELIPTRVPRDVRNCFAGERPALDDRRYRVFAPEGGP